MESRLMWSHGSEGSILVAKGGVGIQAVIKKLQDAEIDDEVKSSSIEFIEESNVLVREFFEQGGLIGLDGKPFIKGIDNVEEFLYHPALFMPRLRKQVIMFYREGSSRRITSMVPELDRQSLSMNINKGVYFVAKNADKALGYSFSVGGGIFFGINNDDSFMDRRNVFPVQTGLAAVVKNEYLSDPKKVVVFPGTVVYQSMFDLAKEAEVSRAQEPIVVSKPENFWHKVLKFLQR